MYFSLIIVKSLQFCERRQIAEPRKYCLVCVIVFLWPVFSLFFVSQRFENFKLIPYTIWLQLPTSSEIPCKLKTWCIVKNNMNGCFHLIFFHWPIYKFMTSEYLFILKKKNGQRISLTKTAVYGQYTSVSWLNFYFNILLAADHCYVL